MRLTRRGLDIGLESHWRNFERLQSFCHKRVTFPLFLLFLTLVVFDSEIGVVEHLWDETVVKVVSLDGVVFVHGADSLDHLCRERRDRRIQRGLKAIRGGSLFITLFLPAQIASI